MAKFYLREKGYGKLKYFVVEKATKKQERELSANELFDDRTEASRKSLELGGRS